MPYKPYNPKDIQKNNSALLSEKIVHQPPAPVIIGSKPVPPSKNSKPLPLFPQPCKVMGPKKEDGDVKMDQSEEEELKSMALRETKDSLNKTSDGKIKKKGNKKWDKKWKLGKSGQVNNANLRRLIFPKAPWKILEELCRSLLLELNYNNLEPVEEEGMKMCVCEVTVNGDQYQASAPDEVIARNIAAEMALQAYVLHSVSEAAASGMAASGLDPLDHAPWSALASLSLFKLLNDWQSHGFSLPMMAPPVGAAPAASRARGESFADDADVDPADLNPAPQHPSFNRKPAKRLPADAAFKHPVQLINEMYPECTYACGGSGGGGGKGFTMTVTLDGQAFTGRAGTKKEAKKNCAAAAAKGLFNVEFNNVNTE